MKIPDLFSQSDGFLPIWIQDIGKRSNLKTDWKLLLWGFVLLNVFGIAWGTFLFYQVSSGKAFTQESENMVEIQTIDREKLSQTLTQLKEQTASFNQVKETSPEISNPSR